MSQLIGFGGSQFELGIYIANRPPIDGYPNQASLRYLAPGELDHIVRHTSNHWRKAFNVYAKLLAELGWVTGTWQEYRDSRLLQAGVKEALMFSAPDLDLSSQRIHVIAGKTYANTLGYGQKCEWLDAHFAVSQSHRVIISPYLDYRQLSNERISRLADLVKSFR